MLYQRSNDLAAMSSPQHCLDNTSEGLATSPSPISLLCPSRHDAVTGTVGDYGITSDDYVNDVKYNAIWSPVIPQGTRPLEHQVAGHFYKNGKFSLLTDKSTPGIILKPIQSFPRHMIECAFYSRVFSPECSDPVLVSLRKFMPRFHGVVHKTENAISYMRLEDAASVVHAPAAVMDVKMGRHTWDPWSTPEKRKRSVEKSPFAVDVGFSIQGFKTSFPNEGNAFETKHFYSDYTRSVTPDQLISRVFRVFFGGSQLRRVCVEKTLDRLREVGDWFRSQTSFCFYSASLLLVHSTDISPNNTCSELLPYADVKFVDFAHVYRANGQTDYNFLFGLDNLVIYMKKLLNENEQ